MDAYNYFKEWYRLIPVSIMYQTLRSIPNKPYSPDKSNIFRTIVECPYRELKVVIVGQDPYVQKGVATGIAFGVNKEPLQPSLEIIKEACINYTIPHNPIVFDYTLESWVKQGVLLLNSALTVEVNNAKSHINLWRPFISSFLSNVSIYFPGMIFVLMGENAQTFQPYLSKYSHIIKVKHPSYYARTNTKMPNVFEEINKLLKLYNNESIEWFREEKF